MKEITLELKVLVPDNYEHLDDAGWIMDDMFDPSSQVVWESATMVEQL